jgi:hypothetical protein
MKKPMSDHDRNKENCLRWQRDAVKFNELDLDMSGLQLFRIPLNHDRNDHNYDGILKEGQLYLISDGGYWRLARASCYRPQNRWDFQLGSHSTHASFVNVIFEVGGLPEVPKRMTELIPTPDEEDEEEY